MIREMIAAAKNSRESSDRVLSIAQRALRKPDGITPAEVKSLAASVLSQAKRDA